MTSATMFINDESNTMSQLTGFATPVTKQQLEKGAHEICEYKRSIKQGG